MFEIGQQVKCFDDGLIVYGVIIAVDQMKELCTIRIGTDTGCNIIQPTTFHLLRTLNS